jgi:hypothetical protein
MPNLRCHKPRVPRLTTGAPLGMRHLFHKNGRLLVPLTFVTRSRCYLPRRSRLHGRIQMKLGLRLPQRLGVDLQHDLVEAARTAEAAGYDSLWTYERLLFPQTPAEPCAPSNISRPRVAHHAQVPRRVADYQVPVNLDLWRCSSDEVFEVMELVNGIGRDVPSRWLANSCGCAVADRRHLVGGTPIIRVISDKGARS